MNPKRRVLTPAQIRQRKRERNAILKRVRPGVKVVREGLFVFQRHSLEGRITHIEKAQREIIDERIEAGKWQKHHRQLMKRMVKRMRSKRPTRDFLTSFKHYLTWGARYFYLQMSYEYARTFQDIALMEKKIGREPTPEEEKAVWKRHQENIQYFIEKHEEIQRTLKNPQRLRYEAEEFLRTVSEE